jgi:hypothetical protein
MGVPVTRNHATRIVEGLPVAVGIVPAVTGLCGFDAVDAVDEQLGFTGGRRVFHAGLGDALDPRADAALGE